MKNTDSSILERVGKVTKIHTDLVEVSHRYFGKYVGKVDATLIESIPTRLNFQR